MQQSYSEERQSGEGRGAPSTVKVMKLRCQARQSSYTLPLSIVALKPTGKSKIRKLVLGTMPQRNSVLNYLHVLEILYLMP